DPHRSPEIINISSQQKNYIKKGVYNANGTLKEATEIQIDSITQLKPTLNSKSKGYGLKSTQQVKGIDENDYIGQLVTYWYFRKDKWIIINSELQVNNN